jgi:hypothetical protein
MLAPNGVLASKVNVGDPCQVGSVAWTADKASARPTPNVLSGAGLLNATACPVIRFRSVVRATVGSIVDVVRFSKHGALCSNSAAIPPMCGAAADVPKNAVGKPPAPNTVTPSMAAMSGLVRPSSVGPRLLKNSAVEFDVSRHDSSGALGEKLPAAIPDAEQIAPTDTTLTGEPPASPCAEMLRLAVL